MSHTGFPLYVSHTGFPLYVASLGGCLAESVVETVFPHVLPLEPRTRVLSSGVN